MVKIKSNVKPPSLVILAAAANTAQELAIEIMVTSGNDSTHMKGSRHYVNAALDFRSKDMPYPTRSKFMAILQKRLGPKYQVILEDDGKANEHIHVERDDLT